MRFTFGGGTGEYVVDRNGRFATGTTVTLWLSETGDSQTTDLLDGNGTPVGSVTSGVLGRIPAFQGPDGVMTLWASADGGSNRWRLDASDDELPSQAFLASELGNPASAARQALDADLSGTYGPGGTAGNAPISPGRRAITHRDHLTDSLRKLQAAMYRPFGLTVIGNSIAFGLYAQGSGLPVQEAPSRHRGWVGQVRTRLERTFGEAGEGVIQMADVRVTQSGTQAIGSIGITRHTPGGRRMDSSSDWIELSTVENAREVWVHGWNDTTALAGSFTYQVDGGPMQTATGIPTAANSYYTFKITGLSDAPHTVRLWGVDSKQIDIAGFSLRTPNEGGVVVNRVAQSGGYIDTVLYVATLDTGTIRSYELTLGRTQTDLLVLAFGANEAGQNGDSVGYTPARYENELRFAVDYATGTYGCDVLLLSTGRRGADSATVQGQENYYAIHEEIAAENPRVAHLDMARVWGDWTAANAAGFMHDTVHPNLLGHSAMAQVFLEALGVTA